MVLKRVTDPEPSPIVGKLRLYREMYTQTQLRECRPVAIITMLDGNHELGKVAELMLNNIGAMEMYEARKRRFLGLDANKKYNGTETEEYAYFTVRVVHQSAEYHIYVMTMPTGRGAAAEIPTRLKKVLFRVNGQNYEDIAVLHTGMQADVTEDGWATITLRDVTVAIEKLHDEYVSFLKEPTMKKMLGNMSVWAIENAMTLQGTAPTKATPNAPQPASAVAKMRGVSSRSSPGEYRRWSSKCQKGRLNV